MGDGSIRFNKLYNKLDHFPVFISRLRYFPIFIEQWLHYLVLWLKKMRGEIIFTDRWPGTNRHLKRKENLVKINNFIYRVFPKPDMFVYLYANPKTIHSRKPELSSEEISRIQKNLDKYMVSYKNLSVETSNLDKSLNIILKGLLKELGENVIEFKNN